MVAAAKPAFGRHDLTYDSPAPPPRGGSSKAHRSPGPSARGFQNE